MPGQNLRIVQTLMHELERKSSKTPNEETELAKLLLKQQQILSTGKPIEKHVSTLNLPKVLSKASSHRKHGSMSVLGYF